MKLKLVEYPFGKDLGLKQEVVWFIQGSFDGKTFMPCVWNDKLGIPAYVAKDLAYAAFDSINVAHATFDKIAEWYREQAKQHQIKILREVEIEDVKSKETVCENDEEIESIFDRGSCEV